MLAFPLVSALAALVASDSLMAPGVSLELARYRATLIRDVRYDLSLDVTRRDTAVGRVRVSFTKVKAGDVILDFRGPDLTVTSVNGAAAPAIEWNGTHLRVPARLLRDGANTIDASFKTPIAP